MYVVGGGDKQIHKGGIMRTVEEKDFENEVKKGLTLVDFYATWCGPCRIMGNMLPEIEEQVGENVNIIKVDVDDAENLARKLGIMSIPTLMIFKDGEMVEKHIGLWQVDDCVQTIKIYM